MTLNINPGLICWNSTRILPMWATLISTTNVLLKMMIWTRHHSLSPPICGLSLPVFPVAFLEAYAAFKDTQSLSISSSIFVSFIKPIRSYRELLVNQFPSLMLPWGLFTTVWILFTEQNFVFCRPWLGHLRIHPYLINVWCHVWWKAFYFAQVQLKEHQGYIDNTFSPMWY